ncbi:MAG: adenylate/guanylate cyclase domain-containing protein [Dongiaceae bacterium]
MDPQTQITQLLIRRRRAAVLAADVAGYSRLMGANEEQTMKRLDAARTIMDSRIRQHGGRIANTAGDSVIAEFNSAVAAVRCAVEVQTALGQRNAALAPADRLQFRIGINYGEVMANRADLLGDNVNVAARIENLAQPGGILVSESVHEQVFGRAAVAFRPLGLQALKNIDRKVAVFEVMQGAAAAAPSAGRATPAVPRPAAPAARAVPPRARPAPAPPGSRAWPLVVALGFVVLLALGAIAYLVTTELLPRAPAPQQAPAAPPSPDAAPAGGAS